MAVILPAAGSFNWADTLNAAINALSARMDAAIAVINNMNPVVTSTSTDETVTSVPFVAGAAPLGLTFVAPLSGKVFVTLTAYLTQDINGEATICSYTVRTGGTIGSGSLVGSAANSDRALVAGRAVNPGAVPLMQASLRTLYYGLTPGVTYNARVEMAVTGGTGHVLRRELLIEPVPAQVT